MRKVLDIINDYFSNMWDGFLHNIPNLIVAILIILAFILLARVIRSLVFSALKNRMQDQLSAKFLSKVVGWVIAIIGLVVGFKVLGLGNLASGLLAGAGLSAFVIGFAFKDIGENFLAGIIMAFSRPFRVGDTVEVNGVVGSVVSLDLRNTHVKTGDGKDVYIPNGAIIKNNLFNSTIDGHLRSEFTLNFGFDENFDEIIKLIKSTLLTVDGIDNENKQCRAFISQVIDDTATVNVQFWYDTYDKTYSALETKNEAISKCLKNLMAQGISVSRSSIEVYNK